MKKIISILTAITLVISIAGCATTNPDGSPNAGQSAGLGAVIGAGLGAAVGYVTTGKASGAIAGAAIGAAVGGLTGFIIGESREREYKSAKQIYQQYPSYATNSTKDDPPMIANIQPYICDSKKGPCSHKSRHLKTVKNGQTVDLAMTYDVVIPKYSDIKEVEVEECNYLVNSKGDQMDKSKLTRKHKRGVHGIDAGIQVQITKNLPDGKYTHVAIVRIGDNEFKKERQIQIVKSDGETKIYASSKRD